MENLLFNSSLAIHIAGGYISLLSGLLVMALRKGGKIHSRLGRIYFVAMMAVTMSSFVLAGLRGSIFLLQIGVFVFYQAVAGFRSVRLRNAVWKKSDILLSLVALLNGCWMVLAGHLVTGVFGAISVFLAFGDIRTWLQVRTGRSIPDSHWLGRHIGMMMGAYIGTLTAFLVVNLDGGGWAWMIWFAPTIIIVPIMQFWVRQYTKGKKMARAAALVAVLLFSTVKGQAQPYIDGGNSRHRFAQLCLGIQWRTFGKDGAMEPRIDKDGVLRSAALPAFGEARILVAGTHFWGHSDFYLTIPVLRAGTSPVFAQVETGFRIMPLRIRSGRASPFFGAGWMPMSFKRDPGSMITTNVFPLSGGVFFTYKRHLFDIGIGYSFLRGQNYFVTEKTSGVIQMNRVMFSAGYRLMFETTVGAEKNWKNGRTKKSTDTLARAGKLNSWTVGVGPSSSFFVRSSTEWEKVYPYAGRHYATLIFPEISAGYYWHRPDVQVSVAFRGMRSTAGGHGYKQELRRMAVTTEAYRFFTDYHGFALFLGPALSLERWQVSEEMNGTARSDVKKDMIVPGLTFGWDIRPDRLQFFYLRTALRYFPRMSATSPGGLPLSLDQLEVNFIQLVLLPERI